jgi:acyl-CoA thioesterase-1
LAQCNKSEYNLEMIRAKPPRISTCGRVPVADSAGISKRTIIVTLIMRLFAFHFAGGDAFFLGTGLLTVAGVVSLARRWSSRGSRCLRFLAFIGGVLVAFSATPLPLWFYAVWAATLVGFLVLIARREHLNKMLRVLASLPPLVATVAAVVWEIAARVPPSLPNREFASLYVIGDSLSVGDESRPEDCWPALIQRAYQVQAVNLAEPGATTRLALRQANRVDAAPCAVLIEIGGNDLLSGVPSRVFAGDLEQLLMRLAHPQRQLVMLELPLPPFYNGYGLEQRRLAKRFGVKLIRRRVLAKVLFHPDATTDGLHLSPPGHKLMADAMWEHVGAMLRVDRCSESTQVTHE